MLHQRDSSTARRDCRCQDFGVATVRRGPFAGVYGCPGLPTTFTQR
jgi:hypothetical protein